jgi:acetoin utilization protein AcuC
MRTSVFLYSPEIEQYRYPSDCPFNTSRAPLTRKTIVSMGLLNGAARREVAPQKATRAELETFHSSHYLDAIIRAEKGDLDADGFMMGLGTPDCPVFRGMYDYAALAAGASITGARMILAGDADVAFNPSGGYHHAGSDNAAGFCYINDIVLAAMTLARGGKRILFLDVDAHHSDGVQDAFYSSKQIMTISLHESGRTLFPGSGFEDEIGAGEGKGYAVNIPLPPGTYDAAYLSAFTEAALPLMKAFDPDAVIMELGMDALAGDPLAHLRLTNNVYVEIIGKVLEMNKPILATGGGGYNVENTARAWALAWSALCGELVDDVSAGMGGAMLENRDWPGGLRDRVILPDVELREEVDSTIEATVRKIRATLFPIHGI